MSNNITALTIKETLSNDGNARAAVKQIHTLAVREGDEQVAILVAQLSPSEITPILEESDYTLPSNILPHISKAQFMGSYMSYPSRWGTNINTADTAQLRAEFIEFLIPLLLLHPNSDGFIKELTKDPLDQKMLLAIALGDYQTETFLTETTHIPEHGTWQEIYAKLEVIDNQLYEAHKEKLLKIGCNQQKQESLIKSTFEALAKRANKYYKQPTEPTKIKIFNGL
jgi:hypothetical protein